MDKSVITVNIFGNEYTIKGVARPDYIVTLANYLNNRMTEIQDATGLKDAKKIAILAAINITDELFEARKESKETMVPKEQMNAIRNKIESLISLVDRELPAETENYMAIQEEELSEEEEKKEAPDEEPPKTED